MNSTSFDVTAGPEFLCIGAQKAGTTWLHSQLKQHPHVWLPHVKELHYFDAIYLENVVNMAIAGAVRRLEALAQSKAPKMSDVEYYSAIVQMPRSDAWYAHIFSRGAGKVRGELSPSYCMIGEEGARHVQRLSPSAKIIYLIRDPVARMVSSLQMAAKRGREIDAKLIERPIVHARGDYAANVPVWDKVFGNNVMYIPFDDIRSRPRDTLRALESFIGLQHFDSYVASEEAVHVGRKVDLPERLVERIRDICAPQYAFLEGRFGADFLRRTK